MSDFKVPGGEVSSVSVDPRLSLDDEITEVTKTAGQPVDVGQAINRQFAGDGAPAIKGGDSEWVAGSEASTKTHRDLHAKTLGEHAKKYDAKMKLRKAQMADLDKRRKAEAKEAFQRTMAGARASHARVKAQMADSSKTNDKAKTSRADNAKAASRVAENLRQAGGSSAPAAHESAPDTSSAPASTGPAPAGPDVGPADPSAK